MCCEDRAAARHAFRVAAGLDSMVLGEPQILGQMKQAVREADEAGTLGTTLHQLFQRSFAVAKEVRSSTEIGAHSISMAAAAVRLAAQLFEDLRRDQGAVRRRRRDDRTGRDAFRRARAEGDGAWPTARWSAASGWPRASAPRRCGWPTCPTRLHEFDAVISCTASTLPIIGLGAVERALKARRHRPMFMVDLAVPRDIEPEVAQLSDVYLYTVDDLSALVQTAGEKRQAAVAAGRGDHRRRRAELRALAGPARRRAADPGAERAGRRLGRARAGARAQAAGARRAASTRCSKRWRAA